MECIIPFVPASTLERLVGQLVGYEVDRGDLQSVVVVVCIHQAPQQRKLN